MRRQFLSLTNSIDFRKILVISTHIERIYIVSCHDRQPLVCQLISLNAFHSSPEQLSFIRGSAHVRYAPRLCVYHWSYTPFNVLNKHGWCAGARHIKKEKFHHLIGFRFVGTEREILCKSWIEFSENGTLFIRMRWQTSEWANKYCDVNVYIVTGYL